MRRGRAGEAVDRLVGIAHHAQVVAAAEPGVEQALLQRRDVLVLVHHEVAVARADLLRDVAVLLQRAGHDHQQVGEVDDAGPALGLLELLVDARHGVRGHRDVTAGRACPLGIGGGRGEHGLRPVDLGREVAHLGAVDPQPQPRGAVADEPDRVVQDVGHRAAEHARGEVLQLAQRRGVEGAGLHAVRAEIAQPGAQLAGRARGEGDGQQLAGRHRAGAHLVGDAVRDRPGLARARAGQDAAPGPRTASAAARCSGSSPASTRSAAPSVAVTSVDPASDGRHVREWCTTGRGFPHHVDDRPHDDHVHHRLVRLLRPPEGPARPRGDHLRRGRHRARRVGRASWS